MKCEYSVKVYWQMATEVIACAKYMVNNNATIRKTASISEELIGRKISKTSLHYKIEKILPDIDKSLYKKVRKVLDKNKNERHLRGGMATKLKHSKTR